MIRPKRSVRGAAATIALTSGISVVAPAVIGAVAHAANTQTMYATTDVNVRSASSNSGKVLTVVARGQSVQVTGEKVRGWIPVAVNGTTGWIYQRFLTEESIRPVHFGSDPLPDTMIATVPVNVRDNSANAGKVLTVAERGQEVQVTGRPDGGWLPVSVNGKSGWIYGRYLATGKVAPAPSKPTVDATSGSSTSRDKSRPALDNAATRTTSGVNVRTAPSPSGQVIDQLADGAGVEVTGEAHGNWVEVRANGHTGWVYRTHLSGKVPAAQPIKHAEPAKHSEPAKSTKHAKDGASTHTTSGVNVRTAPTPKASIVTSLAEGTGIKVTGNARGNWVEVRANGHTGWVYRTHLSGKVPAAQPIKHAEPAKHSEPAKSTKHAKDGASTHTTSGVNVRTAPTPKASIVTSLAEGTGIKVTGNARGNWVEVRANGHTGWVYRTHLSGKVPAAQPIKHAEPVKHKGGDTSRDTTRPSRHHAKDGASNKGSGRVGGRCIASFYDEPQSTASGEQFNPNAMTAAHKSLSLGTHIRVTNVRNGRSVVVRINDRGPYVAGRCVDLSRASFAEIADLGQGTTPITYTVLD
ncbi:septal ring lytic transglycosylase RlpA family protein [Cutibacterium avidum]|uniref:septal ring lytic transglycosylase RlpA family protein n=6 Tax=Cutibacterium avidum TaxID=33010 RepID=UPI002FEF3972